MELRRAGNISFIYYKKKKLSSLEKYIFLEMDLRHVKLFRIYDENLKSNHYLTLNVSKDPENLEALKNVLKAHDGIQKLFKILKIIYYHNKIIKYIQDYQKPLGQKFNNDLILEINAWKNFQDRNSWVISNNNYNVKLFIIGWCNWSG